MKLEDVSTPEPGEGQVLVKLDFAGVNFIDVNQRSGAYKVALPFTPGTEGAGTVATVGGGVTGLASGDRVCFAGIPGAYAEYIVAKAERLVPVPDALGTDKAAAVMLQGMTAHYLVHSICDFGDGDWCVVHAAAGGVGLLLTQIAKKRGLRVIGTVSSSQKVDRARWAGADHVIVYSLNQFADHVLDLTDGKGVRAVYESVGKNTFDESLRCLGPRGYLVLFGQASGPVPPVDPSRLQRGHSLFLTRPQLADYVRSREELTWRSGDILSEVASGDLNVHVHATYPLAEVHEAHRALANRTTTGKLLIEISAHA